MKFSTFRLNRVFSECVSNTHVLQELPPNPKHVRLCTIDDARKDVLPYIHERTVALCEIIAKSLRSYKLDHMIGMRPSGVNAKGVALDSVKQLPFICQE